MDRTVSGWQAANVVEQLMAQAMDRGQDGTLLNLLASSWLYLPGQPHRDGTLTLLAEELDGQTYVPVFTSRANLARYRGSAVDSFILTNCAELADIWPDPAWRLAVNPLAPIAFDIAGADLRASDDGTQPRLDRPVPAGDAPVNRVERLLRKAIASVDPDLLVQTLLSSWVHVAVAHPVEAGMAPGDPRFAWQRFDHNDTAVILMFTSAARIASAVDEPGPFAAARLVEVLRAWPDPSYAFVVNPGTAIEVALSDMDRDALIRLAQSIVTLSDPPRPDITIDTLENVIS